MLNYYSTQKNLEFYLIIIWNKTSLISNKNLKIFFKKNFKVVKWSFNLKVNLIIKMLMNLRIKIVTILKDGFWKRNCINLFWFIKIMKNNQQMMLLRMHTLKDFFLDHKIVLLINQKILILMKKLIWHQETIEFNILNLT